jgi:parallel beta-helix repeat protein
MTRIPFGTIALAGLVAAAAPAARAQVACGDTIGKGQTVTLTADVGPCDGVESAIIIESGVLDLGGHTLSCADTNGNGRFSYGLDIRGKKAVVRNGTVTGCIDNVYVAGSKHTVEGITATAAQRYGFYVASTSSKNRLAGNTATGNADDGFQARGSKHTIEGNTASANGEDGIDLTEAKKVKVTGNTSSGNSDDGIEATGTRNTISGNTSIGNADDGIAVGDRKNKVTGNTSTGNGSTDILAEEPCKNNKFKDNTFVVSPSSCVQ